MDPRQEPIPARQRYLGRYVKWFLDRGAFTVVAKPYLLDPSLGLIDPDQSVPYIDLPLTSDEQVIALADTVTLQLYQMGVREVHYFRRTSPRSSPAWGRYLEALRLASARLTLRIVVVPIPELFF